MLIPLRLNTSQLELQCPTTKDGPTIHEAIIASWPELSTWMKWARDGVPSLAHTTHRAAQSAAGFDERSEINYAAFEKRSGAFVGKFSLFDFEWSVPRVETGFWLSTKMVGRGYAAEALTAITDMAQAMGLVRIELRTHAQNMRSRALAERVGYKLEGTLRKQRRSPGGILADTCVYARVFDPPASQL